MAWITGGAILGGSLISGLAANSAANTQANAAGQANQLAQYQFDTTRADLAPWRTSGALSLAKLSNLLGIPGYSSDPNANQLNFKGTTFANSDALHSALYNDYLSQVGDPSKVSEAAIQQAMAAAAPVGGASTDPSFGSLTKPFTLADFKASPAYNFNLDQGTQALNKAAAARSAYYQPGTLQDVARFSQGLASNEFQNAFGNYWANNQNIYGMLAGQSGSGQNAAVQQGGFGANLAATMGSNLTGAANARASGQVGMANAISGGLGGLTNAYLMNQILSRNNGSLYAPQQPYAVGGFDPNSPTVT